MQGPTLLWSLLVLLRAVADSGSARLLHPQPCHSPRGVGAAGDGAGGEEHGVEGEENFNLIFPHFCDKLSSKGAGLQWLAPSHMPPPPATGAANKPARRCLQR